MDVHPVARPAYCQHLNVVLSCTREHLSLSWKYIGLLGGNTVNLLIMT